MDFQQLHGKIITENPFLETWESQLLGANFNQFIPPQNQVSRISLQEAIQDRGKRKRKKRKDRHGTLVPCCGKQKCFVDFRKADGQMFR